MDDALQIKAKDGIQIKAENGGKVTAALESGGCVGLTVNCKRDGVPAYVQLTLEEAAQLHGALETLILAQ